MKLSQLAPAVQAHAITEASHVVQFYENDVFLVDTVSRLIQGAFEQGKRTIIIATHAHLTAIEKKLAVNGVNLSAAKRREQYTSVDAAVLLSRIMIDGQPDAGRFHDIVGELVACGATRYKNVWAFGEMVALLWAQAKHEAALRLESLWNDLATVHSFSLCCAYPMHGFSQHGGGGRFIDVCTAHSHVVPTENYLSLTDATDSLRTMARRQQGGPFTLRQRERQLFDVGSQAKGRYWLGMDGRILWANKAELNLLGYGSDEYVGRHISEFHIEPAVAADILRRLLSGEVLYDYPVKRRRKDGTSSHALMYSGGLWKWEKFIYVRCFTRAVSAPVHPVFPALADIN
ncbi:MAG TPA: MEDS domain-containing protein [Gammaproteobacteria bacterium]